MECPVLVLDYGQIITFYSYVITSVHIRIVHEIVNMAKILQKRILVSGMVLTCTNKKTCIIS